MSKIGDLRQHLLALYQEHLDAGMLPTSGRFLFYELVQRGIIAKAAKPRTDGKKGRRPDQDMIDALTDLRESGDIPWNAIVDETRSLDDGTGWKSIKDAVLGMLNYHQLDPWDGAAPLVLTESRSLAGVLRATVRDYRAIIAPTNGQVAGFLHNDVAPKLRDGQRVLYLGDYDLAGNDIEDNSKSVLERYADLQWERLALTGDQVRDYRDLNGNPLIPIVKRDARFKNGGAHDAVETEALSQAVIVQIVRDRLDALLPEPLESVLEREEAEREELRKLIR